MQNIICNCKAVNLMPGKDIIKITLFLSLSEVVSNVSITSRPSTHFKSVDLSCTSVGKLVETSELSNISSNLR